MEKLFSVFCVVFAFAVAICLVWCLHINLCHGSDVYSSLLPNTVTRSHIGFQQFGPYLQLNPIARNVRPYDNKRVIQQKRHITVETKKKHPEDVFCYKFHFSVREY